MSGGTDDEPPELPPVGAPGDCDRCRDEESGESTGVYEPDPDVGSGYNVCECGTEPTEVDED